MEHNAENEADTMPKSQWCPIGALNLHTYNHERNECIWSGPNKLAWADGQWVEQPNGTHAWSVIPPEGQPSFADDEGRF